jgi:hypothetical protein
LKTSGHWINGSCTENASTKVDPHSVRQSPDPVAVISPFNFPAMMPMGFFPLALAASFFPGPKPVWQRHRDLHQRRRGGPPLPERLTHHHFSTVSDEGTWT